MSKFLIALAVVLSGIFLMGACGASIVTGKYNEMVSSSEDVDAKWSQVENVYQRRFDLIPNLVETVKGYAGHEADTLTAVTEARAKVGQININPGQLTPASLAQFQSAQDGLSSMLSRLMVVVEKYPDLKANEGFLRLQDELAGTENRIAVERRNYNSSAQGYNSNIKSFPNNLIAGYFDFKEKPYFKAEEGSNKAPKVDFSRGAKE